MKCSFDALRVENASKGIAFVGGSSKAGCYERVTRCFITCWCHFKRVWNLFVTAVVQRKTGQINAKSTAVTTQHLHTQKVCVC